MTIQQNFSSSRGFPVPPVNLGLSASGNFYDMKKFIEFSTDIFVPQTGDTTVTKFHVDIDLASASSGDNKTFNITNKIFSSEVTKNKFVHNISIGVANDYSHDYIFAFQDGFEYKILYEIYINHKPSGSSTTTTYKLSHIQYFRYFANPVTISNIPNFSFNDNVQVGDNIEVSGLSLNHVLKDASNNPIDTTVPEGRVNVAAIQFRFQEVDIPVLNNNGVRMNDEPTEYYTVDMSYNPLGNYTLQNNTLTTGKIYKVDADAHWALGYFTSERSSQHLYVLNRPVVTEVKVENLASAAIDDANVVTITTESLLNAGDTVTPSKIWFEFYNNSNVLVARAGDGNPNGAISTILSGHGVPIVQNNTYSFSLSKINKITTQGIIIGDIHTVKAIVLYPGEPGYENVKQLRTSQPVSVTFVNVKPLIASITPYDVQNDGGNDGIFHPNSTDVDSPNQIVATVAVNNAAYKLYAPSHIKFNIYNSAGTTKLAETSDYVFSNSLSTDVNGNVIGNFLYNILLNEVTLLGGAVALTNGTSYKVKAQVQLSDHNSDNELRESQEFTNVTFSQNVAPVPSVNITNTYLLNTNNDPSSFSANFTASPLVGISGYFMKTAQFGSVYSKQLDVATTKFRIEYKLNGSANWVLANRVALGQRTSGETRTDAAARIGSVDDESYIVTTTDGQYANIIGTGLGTSQGEMIFYIPQNQGAGNSTAFTESNTVTVRVTVVDTTGLWAPGQSTSTQTLATPDPLQIIKKIIEYDSTGSSEPWNIEKDNSLLYVHLNGNIVEVNKSAFKQYSNTIITELDQGWRIINTGVGTNGAQEGDLPKVDLSYYENEVSAAEQTSSNSSRVNQINGMGAYVVINQNQGAIKYPFIVVYTTPTVTSANKSELYKSKLLYSSSVSGNTADSTRVGLTLLYTGTDNPLFRPDIPSGRRVKMDFNAVSSDTFGNYATEFVNYVSVETSSDASTHQAGDFNFTLSEAGLTTSLSFLSSLVMSFTKNLFLNIPVELSLSRESVKIGYKYNPSHSYIYRTFNFPSTVVSLHVDPNQGTTLYYSTSYIVEGTQGLTVEVDVPNKYFPVSSDYTIANSAYNTFNTHSESKISFDLTLAAASTNRLDGVNVYFTSPTQTNGSGINKVRIGSYVSSGSKTITLLNATGGFLKVINASGSIINSASVWGNYDLANISFGAFRDARVTTSNATYTSTSNVSDPVLSNFYVETGSQSTFGSPTNRNPVWNVPVLTRPDSDASGTNKYVLSGGVINITNNATYHYIKWPTASDANSLPFTYDLKLSKNISTSSVIDTQQNLAVNTHILPIDLATVAEYTIEITKVFNGNTNQRELSPVDSIVFSSIQVHTNNMYVEVENPSNASSVTIGWLHPAIERWATTFGTFDDNIYAHHIQYRTNPSNNYVKLDSNSGLIENPAPGPNNIQKLYTLPVQTLGTVYEFVMYVEAQVKFKLNNVFSSDKSLPYPVPLTPVTQDSKYRVSTIPSITLPHTTPVLVQGSSDPTLLLNLNAKGLENEGFVSVVVILTQDGTSAKPDGEQALLIFPDPNSNHPFTFLNTLPLNGGAGPGDVRLAGGDSAVSAPKNVAPSVLSTQNNNVTASNGVYVINGSNNPTLSFIRGKLHTINVNSPGHPFWIQTVPGAYSAANIYNTGVTGNGIENGIITINVALDAPTLYYASQYHASMNGTINVSNSPSPTPFDYTLTIGTAGSDGRYGLSTLKMPTSANSGFIDSVPVNYMVILTTRRGTDIAVGDFTYMSLPAVQNVSINTSVVNGETQYTVNFNINSS